MGCISEEAPGTASSHSTATHSPVASRHVLLNNLLLRNPSFGGWQPALRFFRGFEGTKVMFSPRRLNQMEAEFEAANIRIGEATWSVYSGEGTPDLDGAQKEIASLFSDPSKRAAVETGHGQVDPKKDPLLARRLEIWLNCFNGSAVDSVPEIYTLKNRLQQRIASFEFHLDGKRVLRSELQKIVRNEPDRNLRRRAWQAMAALAASNREDLRLLMELRNLRARELGYRDYVNLVFRVQEIDEKWLYQTLDQIAAEASPHYKALIESLAGNIGVQRLAPWDVQFAIRHKFQLSDDYFSGAKALDSLKRTAGALGFPVDSLPIRTVIRDIPFSGYNVAVHIPGDTRFLVNPSEGQSFYVTSFHEYGHSLQAVFTTIEWPILKEYEWVMGAHTAAYSEGMAEVMGEFARRPDWLCSVAGVPPELADRYRTEFLPAQVAVRYFDLLLNMRVELAAYAEGARDMGACERQLNREIRLLEFPEEEPPHWEANTWYTSYPVYWQNYILSSLIAAQVHRTLTAQFGEKASSNPKVADYLKEYFYAPGNSLTWMQRISRGTGRPLDPEAYLNMFRR